MHICIISEFYPTEDQPLFPFVQQLAYSLSNEGVKCSVISPQSITKALVGRGRIYPTFVEDVTPEDHKISVLRPYTLTFSNTQNLLLQKLAAKLFGFALKRSIRFLGRIDFMYCYFWHVGYNTALAFHNTETPIIVQASECSISINKYLKREDNNKRISAVVCASKKNYDESLEEGLLINKNSCIIPNGYREDEFYPSDRVMARKEVGLPQDAFIVAFVGGFQERKGIDRLSDALLRFNDVYSIFIGQGNLEPSCGNILFKGVLPHKRIIKYLNCADVFVLPTNAEGSCNAIIEALACGLPVISSNKSFNDEILDDRCSIRIDENNVDEIYESIRKLKNDKVLRDRMSNAAIEKSKTFTIENRAKAIKVFLENQIKHAQ